MSIAGSRFLHEHVSLTKRLHRVHIGDWLAITEGGEKGGWRHFMHPVVLVDVIEPDDRYRAGRAPKVLLASRCEKANAHNHPFLLPPASCIARPPLRSTLSNKRGSDVAFVRKSCVCRYMCAVCYVELPVNT